MEGIEVAKLEGMKRPEHAEAFVILVPDRSALAFSAEKTASQKLPSLI